MQTADINVCFRTWNVNGRLGDASTVTEFLRPYTAGNENADHDAGRSSSASPVTGSRNASRAERSAISPHRQDLVPASSPNTLDSSPDVFVVSLQELVPLTTQNVVMSHEKSREHSNYWEAAIVQILAQLHGHAYVSVAARSLVGVFTLVAVKALHAPYVSGLGTDALAIGYAGVLANKGAVAVKFRMYASNFLFIGSHLAAGVSKCKDRNEGFHRVLNELFAGQVHDCKRPNVSPTNNGGSRPTSASAALRAQRDARTEAFLDNFDFCFWLGDLNYRLDGLSKEECFVRCKRHEWANLICHDQLTAQRAMGDAFKGFHEGQVDFPPTYKYYPGTAVYDVRHKKKSHTPAWCDRVLWRTRRSADACLQLRSYGTKNLLMSDHMPVGAEFLVTVVLDDEADDDDDENNAADMEAQSTSTGGHVRGGEHARSVHHHDSPAAASSPSTGVADWMLVSLPTTTSERPVSSVSDCTASTSSKVAAAGSEPQWRKMFVQLGAGWLSIFASEADSCASSEASGGFHLEVSQDVLDVDELDQQECDPPFVLVVSEQRTRRSRCATSGTTTSYLSSVSLESANLSALADRQQCVYFGFDSRHTRALWRRRVSAFRHSRQSARVLFTDSGPQRGALSSLLRRSARVSGTQTEPALARPTSRQRSSTFALATSASSKKQSMLLPADSPGYSNNMASSPTMSSMPNEHVQLRRKHRTRRGSLANFIMCGWMRKRRITIASQPKLFNVGGQKSRYFVLDFEKRTLQYHADEACSVLKGSVAIDASTVLEITGIVKIRLTTGHGLVVNLEAPSSAALRVWHGGLREVIRMAVAARDTGSLLDPTTSDGGGGGGGVIDSDAPPSPSSDKLASKQKPKLSANAYEANWPAAAAVADGATQAGTSGSDQDFAPKTASSASTSRGHRDRKSASSDDQRTADIATVVLPVAYSSHSNAAVRRRSLSVAGRAMTTDFFALEGFHIAPAATDVEGMSVLDSAGRRDRVMSDLQVTARRLSIEEPVTVQTRRQRNVPAASEANIRHDEWSDPECPTDEEDAQQLHVCAWTSMLNDDNSPSQATVSPNRERSLSALRPNVQVNEKRRRSAAVAAAHRRSSSCDSTKAGATQSPSVDRPDNCDGECWCHMLKSRKLLAFSVLLLVPHCFLVVSVIEPGPFAKLKPFLPCSQRRPSDSPRWSSCHRRHCSCRTPCFVLAIPEP